MNDNIDVTLATKLAGAKSSREATALLFDFMQHHGQGRYDESVTQLEHALQAAHLARESGAPRHEITAALLHDIGHFLMDEHDSTSDFTKADWFHEAVGAEQLQPFFGDEVLEPIRLHVAAKRYLCTIDCGYYAALSPASQRSYVLQGGPLNEREIAAFEAHPHYRSAVRLRRWDDGAKIEGLDLSPLASFAHSVETCFRSR